MNEKQLDAALAKYFGTDLSAEDKAFVAVMKQFCLRQLEANKKGCIDNRALYAGSPMYYYCVHCKVLAAKRHETHTDIVILICGACNSMPRNTLAKAKAIAKEIGIVLDPPDAQERHT